MTLLDQFKQITTFVFDIDGVLTDGTLFVFDDGQFVRRMHIKDGFALQLAIKKGYKVMVMSGADASAVKVRLEKLGITDIFFQVKNKKEKLTEYVSQHNLSWNQVLFMGDDIPDYDTLQQAGVSCAPADAASEVKQIAKYVSLFAGGQGCVRDVIEKVLKLNGHWELHTDIASK